MTPPRARVTRKAAEFGMVARLPDGRYSYVPSSAIPIGRTLALSFPGRSPTTSTNLPAFFDGLVPEGWLLREASKLRPDIGKDRFALLLAFGGDTMGDVSVVEPEESQDKEQRITSDAVRVEPLKGRAYGMGLCLSCFRRLSGEPTVGEYHVRCARGLFVDPNVANLQYDLASIEIAARENLKARLVLPGMQPKASLSLGKDNDGGNRLTIAGFDGGLFILKPRHPEIAHFPENEALMMELARRAGIETAQSALVRDTSGHLHYITRRFDRVVNVSTREWDVSRLAMEDFGQILGKLRDQEKYNITAEQVAKVLRLAHASERDRQELFSQVYFSFLVGNVDLHSRNLAVLTDAGVRLAPAFDITSTFLLENGEPDNSMSIAVNGAKTGVTRKSFVSLGAACGLAEVQAQSVMSRIERSLQENVPLLDALLPSGSADYLEGYFEERMRELDGSFKGLAGSTVARRPTRTQIASVSAAEESNQERADWGVDHPILEELPQAFTTTSDSKSAPIARAVQDEDADTWVAFCRNGAACANPTPSRRPARLRGARKGTGECSYCVAARAAR